MGQCMFIITGWGLRFEEISRSGIVDKAELLPLI